MIFPFPKGLYSSMLLAGAGAVLTASIALSAARADESHVEILPSQLRRLTEAQYRGAIADAFGADIKVLGRFEPDLRVDGLLAVGTSAVAVTPAGFEQYEAAARGIAAQVTDEAHRDSLVGCAPGAADPDGARCAETFFQRTGLCLYRRPLSIAEAKIFVSAALAASRQLGDFHDGLAAALAGMLSSPDFLFRIDTPAPTGGQIDGYSKASRLSFLLWNAIPDEALLQAAAKGELETAEGRARQADRLMASPRFTDGMRAFFTDYLRLDNMDGLSKDTLIYPAFTASIASAAREQTLRTITSLLIDRNGDYRDLFTTRSIAMHRSLGPLYDIPVSRKDWYIHEFPQGDPRAGLLTQASLLALHSHPGRTSPTLRGLALTETFLCEKVPSPPANVNFAVVQDINNPTLKTTRARLQAHLDDEECASCHRRTDPMGLGLEQFDGVGQFRTVEQDQPIDVTGSFEKKPFDGAAQLGQLFHDSEKVSACLVRTAWRYAHGRNPGVKDGPAIDALTRRFAEDGYRLTALMRAIALHPDFYAMPRMLLKGGRTIAGQQRANGGDS
jgi:hypothetical protein